MVRLCACVARYALFLALYPVELWGTATAGPVPPNGRVLDFNTKDLDEAQLLGQGGKGALYALGRGPADFHPERAPWILVHGLGGHPSELQPIIDRFRTGPIELYILCFDGSQRRTSLSGLDLADELRRLAQQSIGPGRDLMIVGHSLGGIISRLALNELAAGARRGIERFGRVRLVAVDSPWHGYAGPSDRGAGRLMMALARPFLAAGLFDMRVQSAMFQGDPDSRSLAQRAGLLKVQLPANVVIDLVFAERGSEVLDYSEGVLVELADKLARYYRDETPVRGDARLQAYWLALLSSSTYFAFQDAMRRLADAGTLDPRAVRAALEYYFPKLPGDHAGVLRGETGRWGLLDYLAVRAGSPGLRPPPRPFGYDSGP